MAQTKDPEERRVSDRVVQEAGATAIAYSTSNELVCQKCGLNIGWWSGSWEFLERDDHPSIPYEIARHKCGTPNHGLKKLERTFPWASKGPDVDARVAKRMKAYRAKMIAVGKPMNEDTEFKLYLSMLTEENYRVFSREK